MLGKQYLESKLHAGHVVTQPLYTSDLLTNHSHGCRGRHDSARDVIIAMFRTTENDRAFVGGRRVELDEVESIDDVVGKKDMFGRFHVAISGFDSVKASMIKGHGENGFVRRIVSKTREGQGGAWEMVPTFATRSREGVGVGGDLGAFNYSVIAEALEEQR